MAGFFSRSRRRRAPILFDQLILPSVDPLDESLGAIGRLLIRQTIKRDGKRKARRRGISDQLKASNRFAARPLPDVRKTNPAQPGIFDLGTDQRDHESDGR